MEAAGVAAKLRADLGWYAWANDIEKGRANQSDLADALDGAVREKEDWLKRHTFQPNSEAEGRHERMTAWCRSALDLITEMQDEPAEGRDPLMRDNEQQVEKVEYRVVGASPLASGAPYEKDGILTLATARRWADFAQGRFLNVRIQKRTVTPTLWEDVTDV